MRRLFQVLLVISAVLVVIVVIGPRPDTRVAVRFDPAAIGDDVEAYLEKREAGIANLKPGAEKEIIWNDASSRDRTALAIVYIHGFSATKMEIRPVPDQIANATGSNVFYTRLTGHGRDGPAMAEPKLNDWVDDVAEAIAIGERIGDRILLIGTSTGASLITLAAANPKAVAKVKGAVLLSPNYAIRGASIGLMNMPWGEQLLPPLLGRERSFEPHNAQQAKWWTTSYPLRSVFAMGALLKVVSQIDYSTVTLPALFLVSPDDRVIIPQEARDVFEMWGGPKKLVEITDAEDPSSHVIAGDILSPSTTPKVTGEILTWVETLN